MTKLHNIKLKYFPSIQSDLKDESFYLTRSGLRYPLKKKKKRVSHILKTSFFLFYNKNISLLTLVFKNMEIRNYQRAGPQKRILGPQKRILCLTELPAFGLAAGQIHRKLDAAWGSHSQLMCPAQTTYLLYIVPQ